MLGTYHWHFVINSLLKTGLSPMCDKQLRVVVSQNVLLRHPRRQQDIVWSVNHVLLLPLEQHLLLHLGKGRHHGLQGVIRQVARLVQAAKGNIDDAMFCSALHEFLQVIWQWLGWAALDEANVLEVWGHGARGVH